MSYAIVFSSKTGNTRLLADTLRASLPQNECTYFGAPAPEALEAETLYIGFWTDKGHSDDTLTTFLQTLKGKRIFLFGTAGFGGSAEYFEQILAAVQKSLDESNTVIGTYMCQGKMPMTVRQQYEKMLQQPNHAPNLEMLMDLFLGHLGDVGAHGIVHPLPQLVGGDLFHQHPRDALDDGHHVGIGLVELGADLTAVFVGSLADLLIEGKALFVKQRLLEPALGHRHVADDDHGAAALGQPLHLCQIFLVRKAEGGGGKDDAVLQLQSTVINGAQDGAAGQGRLRHEDRKSVV